MGPAIGTIVGILFFAIVIYYFYDTLFGWWRRNAQFPSRRRESERSLMDDFLGHDLEGRSPDPTIAPPQNNAGVE